MPESPRYLSYHERTNEAMEILVSFKKDDHRVQSDLQLWSRAHHKTGYMSVLKEDFGITYAIPVFGLFIFEQLIGAVPILFYLHKIFKRLGECVAVLVKMPMFQWFNVILFRWKTLGRFTWIACHLVRYRVRRQHPFAAYHSLQRREHQRQINVVSECNGCDFGRIGPLLSLHRLVCFRWNGRFPLHSIDLPSIVLLSFCHRPASSIQRIRRENYSRKMLFYNALHVDDNQLAFDIRYHTYAAAINWPHRCRMGVLVYGRNVLADVGVRATIRARSEYDAGKISSIRQQQRKQQRSLTTMRWTEIPMENNVLHHTHILNIWYIIKEPKCIGVMNETKKTPKMTKSNNELNKTQVNFLTRLIHFRHLYY